MDRLNRKHYTCSLWVFVLGLMCFGLRIQAQDAQEQQPLRLANPFSLQQTHFAPNSLFWVSAPDGSGKNSEIIDTVSGNSAFFVEVNAETGRQGANYTTTSDSVCPLFYSYNENIRGYLGGTRDTTTAIRGNQTRFTTNLAQHGIRMTLPARLDQGKYYIDQVFIYFAEGTYAAGGGSNPYYIRAYPSAANGSITAQTQPIFEQPFLLSDWPLEWDRSSSGIRPFFINYSETPPVDAQALNASFGNNYSLMVDVANAEANDSLNFMFLSNHCAPPDYPRGLVYLREPGTFAYQGFAFFPTFYGTEESYNNGTITRFPISPIIIPVLFFDNSLVSRNDYTDLGRVGGMNLYSAYPNAAVDFTNIRFTLDHNDDVTIRIMDNLGREIRSETFRAVAGETTHRLDTRDLSCGIYTYLVETNQGSMGSRLMIER